MVGHAENYIIIVFFNSFQDGSNHLTVKILNSLDFILHVAGMGSLIRSFHMDVDEIVILEGVQSRLPFAEIIGVNIPCGALHIYDIKARTDSDALDQINCRNNRSGQSVFLLICLNPGDFAMPPEPYRVGRQKALFLAPLIDRMIMKHHLCMIHDTIKRISAITAWE